MTTKADEIKMCLDALNGTIKAEEQRREQKRETLRALDTYIDHLCTRRTRIEAELAREEAPLIKPLGKCVTIDGWDV